MFHKNTFTAARPYVPTYTLRVLQIEQLYIAVVFVDSQVGTSKRSSVANIDRALAFPKIPSHQTFPFQLLVLQQYWYISFFSFP